MGMKGLPMNLRLVFSPTVSGWRSWKSETYGASSIGTTAGGEGVAAILVCRVCRLQPCASGSSVDFAAVLRAVCQIGKNFMKNGSFAPV
eukprot:m.438655 g.438655  ORF g.438655 m.438655 type:complete len:89 (+) comp18268_c0_seq1:354-620(+)